MKPTSTPWRDAALACALSAWTALAAGQTVEYRIMERRGQLSIPIPFGSTDTTNNILDLVVQARVTGVDLSNNEHWGLGAFGFNLVIVGEPDANGALRKSSISLPPAPTPPDNLTYPQQGPVYSPGGTPPGIVTYSSSFATGNTLRQHGLAAQFGYAAGISASLAGNINSNTGSFTNTPVNQEIGLITGRVAGTDLFNTPGVDVDPNRHWENNPSYDPLGDNDPLTNPSRRWVNNPNGVPDTYAGPLPPPNGPPNPIATVPPSAFAYFGEDEQYFDIFRFQYTTPVSTPRTLRFRLQNILAQVFSVLELGNGLWGGQNRTFPTASVVVTGLDIRIGDPQGACCFPNGTCGITAQPPCVSPGTWTLDSLTPTGG